MLKLRSTLVTILAGGSLVFFASPLFACGEDSGDEDEDETSVITLCGEDSGDEDEDETSLCGEDSGDEDEDET